MNRDETRPDATQLVLAADERGPITEAARLHPVAARALRRFAVSFGPEEGSRTVLLWGVAGSEADMVMAYADELLVRTRRASGSERRLRRFLHLYWVVAATLGLLLLISPAFGVPASFLGVGLIATVGIAIESAVALSIVGDGTRAGQ